MQARGAPRLVVLSVLLPLTARKKVLRVCGGNARDAVELPLWRLMKRKCRITWS